VLDTYTCDEDPDLVERGGLLGTEEQGAYQTAGRSWQSYIENMRVVFLWSDKGSEGPAVILLTTRLLALKVFAPVFCRTSHFSVYLIFSLKKMSKEDDGVLGAWHMRAGDRLFLRVSEAS